MSNYLHIVCLDAPSPADYGGAIDMHYKIKALAEAGKKIILHYFAYKPGRNASGLENYCIEINTYKRKKSFSFFTPYIIASRINQQLIDRLNSDEHPVLLEGAHCAGIIPYIKNQKRIVLRMHNEESSYYAHLAKSERNFWKKVYFIFESRLLYHYQKQMTGDVQLACLSHTDAAVFQKNFGFSKIHFVPCFIPWQEVLIQKGKGNFCLYHGNLAVSENENAALWLIENVFSKTASSLVIAGRGASPQLQQKAAQYKNVQVAADPSMQQIDELIANAHINILPSLNATGVKLKLLHALLRGRFCITNNSGISGSGIDSGAYIADTPEEYLHFIDFLKNKEFTEQQMQEREKILAIYNNKAGAKKLSELWLHCL